MNVQNPSAGRRASGNVRTRSYYSTEKGEIFTNFNNQHGVRQSSLFSGKHLRLIEESIRKTRMLC